MSSVLVATCEEKLGREFSVATAQGSRGTLTFVCRECLTDEDAYDILEITAPATFRSMPLQHLAISEDIGGYIYIGTATYYYSTTQKVAGDSRYQFDTGGGMQHITQSLSTINKYAPPAKTAPDFKGAIGVTDKNVSGCDIIVPAFTWTETHYKSDADIDQAYKDVLFDLTGSVNDSTFRNRNDGEVLFLGASGSQQANEDWEIAYKFSAHENLSGIVIGDVTGIAKGGWEYLWVRYEDIEDATAKKLVKRPVAVIVERVYETKDFTDLEI